MIGWWDDERWYHTMTSPSIGGMMTASMIPWSSSLSDDHLLARLTHTFLNKTTINVIPYLYCSLSSAREKIQLAHFLAVFLQKTTFPRHVCDYGVYGMAASQVGTCAFNWYARRKMFHRAVYQIVLNGAVLTVCFAWFDADFMRD